LVDVVTVTDVPPLIDASWAAVRVTVCVGSGADVVYVTPADGGFVRSVSRTQTVCVWPSATDDVELTPEQSLAESEPAPPLELQAARGTRRRATVVRDTNCLRLSIEAPLTESEARTCERER
jgi:hypothetical protein